MYEDAKLFDARAVDLISVTSLLNYLFRCLEQVSSISISNDLHCQSLRVSATAASQGIFLWMKYWLIPLCRRLFADKLTLPISTFILLLVRHPRDFSFHESACRFRGWMSISMWCVKIQGTLQETHIHGYAPLRTRPTGCPQFYWVIPSVIWQAFDTDSGIPNEVWAAVQVAFVFRTTFFLRCPLRSSCQL